MKGIELLTTYPNAAKVVKEWFMNQMIASMESDNITPEEFKQAMIDEGISDERLGTLIDIQPRTFNDCFDENKIYVMIYIHTSIKKEYVLTEKTKDDIKKGDLELLFTPQIFIEHWGVKFLDSSYNRKEAEITAINEAFHYLEEKLTGNLNFEQLNKEEENETK